MSVNVTIDFVLSAGVQHLNDSKKSRLSDVIQTAQLPLGFSCGGRGACRACIVYIQGEVSSISEREYQLLSGVVVDDESWSPRVACLTRVLGPLKVRATYW